MSTVTMPVAQNVPATTAAPAVGAYCGVIKSFNDQRGFGWLSCPAAGRDVFVHVNDLSRPEDRLLLPFVPMTVLQFDIAHRPRGLSAVNVSVVHTPQASAALPTLDAKDVAAARARRLANPVASVSLPAQRTPLPDVPPDQRFRGTIVYYAATKGFGFVQSPQLPSKVYMHVYSVEKYGAHELELGMPIEFSVRENAKGKYASAIKVLRNVEGRPEALEECPYGIEMQAGRHRGTLRTYDPKRTLGWVTCGQTEVLMHIYELRAHDAEDRLVDGLMLEFTIGIHGRGPTAYDIDIVEDLVAAPSPASAKAQTLPSPTSPVRSPFITPLTPHERVAATLAAAAAVAALRPGQNAVDAVGPLLGAITSMLEGNAAALASSIVSPAVSTAPPSPVCSRAASTRSSSPSSETYEDHGAVGANRAPLTSSPVSPPSSTYSSNCESAPSWSLFQKGQESDAGVGEAYWGSVFKAFVNPWSTA
jgi:cold shock CspA family protein